MYVEHALRVKIHTYTFLPNFLIVGTERKIFRKIDISRIFRKIDISLSKTDSMYVEHALRVKIHTYTFLPNFLILGTEGKIFHLII